MIDDIRNLVEAGNYAAVVFGVEAGVFGDATAARKQSFTAAAVIDSPEAYAYFMNRWAFDADENMGPLACAAEHDAVNVVQHLLNAGADVNGGSEDVAPILAAVSTGSVRCVEALLRAGASVDEEWLLSEAIMNHDPATVRLLLDAGVPFRRVGESVGLNSLAVVEGPDSEADLEIVRLLLAAGADPNAADDDGVPVLANARGEFGLGLMRLLVAAGADPNAVSESGESVLATHAWLGHVDAVEFLVSVGADVNAVWRGGSVLLQAVRSRNFAADAVGVTRVLLRSGVRLDDRTRDEALLFDHTGATLRVLVNAGLVLPEEWLVFAREHLHARMILEKVGVRF